MEGERIFVVDSWKSYALFALLAIIAVDLFPEFTAGAGKSILWCAVSLVCLCDKVVIYSISSAIIEDIKNMLEARSALIAYHYFDFKDASKCDIRGLLASLLFQLSRASDPCRDVLYQLYTTCGDGSDQPSNSALAEYLDNILKLPRQLPIFIILDALDECPGATETPSAREKVLSFVEDVVVSCHPNLFLCITSRPEQDIQAVLDPLTSAGRQVLLHEEHGQREDISLYVRSFVHSDRTMQRWREEDKQCVINTLSERANGM